MDASSLKCHRRQGAKNADHLGTDGFDQPKFFFDIPISLGKMFGEPLVEVAGKGRLILGDHVLHPVTVDRLEIGEMANDLPS